MTASKKVMRWVTPALALTMLAAIYLITLQRDINGSNHPYTTDVGEIQVALNLWGTIHFTGYPLYTMLAASITSLTRLLGANPAASAAVPSLLFMLGTIAVVMMLIIHRTDNTVLAGALGLALGVTQSFWVHAVIAEVYSLYTLFAALALWWVLKDNRQWQRRDWLIAAFILGLGFGHHRAMGFLVPGLAVWLLPQVIKQRRQMPLTLLLGTLVFVGTFIVYLYLPLRDVMGAQWVYGSPGTWEGFWREFFGREAQSVMVPPANLADFGTHVRFILGVLVEQLTLPGLVLGGGAVTGLVAAKQSRHMGLTLLVGVLGYLGFAFWLPEAVLAPAFLMPVTILLIIAFAEALHRGQLPYQQYWAAPAAAAWAGSLVLLNMGFVHVLTTEAYSRTTINEVATYFPQGRFETRPTLVMPWGRTHFALAYGLYVTEELEGFDLVDHRADFGGIVAEGTPLVTLPITYYTVHVTGFEQQWEAEAALSSVAPGIIQMNREAILTEEDTPAGEVLDMGIGIERMAYEVTPLPEGYHVTVYWRAAEPPTEDYSVFMHLWDGDQQGILTQADQSNPVYGWHPTSEWRPGEVVRDDYILPYPQGAQGPYILRFGMYRQQPDGSFINYGETVEPLP